MAWFHSPSGFEEADAIGITDRFALQYRMRDGRTVGGPVLPPAEADDEALMRRRKAWYCQREPRPGVSVISARRAELALDSRR